jgi:hypothetical protein
MQPDITLCRDSKQVIPVIPFLVKMQQIRETGETGTEVADRARRRINTG